MTKCSNCPYKYPEEILSPMMGGGVSGAICGICALEIKNAIHGINDTEFTGETAEYFRLEAIKVRKDQDDN